MLPLDPNRLGPFMPEGPKPGAPRALPFTKAGPLGLFLLLGVVVLAVAVLGKVGSGPARKDGGTITEPDRMTREPRVEVLTDGDLAEQYPTTVRGELETELTAWFAAPERAPIDDAADFIEPEWMAHLRSDDVRPRLARLPAWVYDASADAARIAAEPAAFRGRLLGGWGKVEFVEEIELPSSPVVHGWRVVLLDPSGRPWAALTPVRPPAEVVPGAWAKAFGAFVKLRPSGDAPPALVLHCEHPVIRSFPPVAHDAISPEWAAAVDDSTLESAGVRPGEEDAFWNLMNYVRTLGPEGYREQVRSGKLVVTDMTSSRGATDLKDQPVLHRFELVRLRLGIAQGDGAFVTEQDLMENVGGIRSVFRGYAIDDQQRVIWVMTPFPAETFRIAGARLATVEGFFYKRFAAKPANPEKPPFWMPVIVAASIEPVDVSKAPSSVAVYAAWIAIAGAAACAVLWVVLLVRSRRAAADAQRRHQERIAKRSAEKQTAGTA